LYFFTFVASPRGLIATPYSTSVSVPLYAITARSITNQLASSGVGIILVPRASRPRASSLGPGTHGTRSARKLAVVSKAHALELGHFSTRKNFHSEVLRRNEVFVLTYVDIIILPSENCSTSAK
jgi:hypothetical protein